MTLNEYTGISNAVLEKQLKHVDDCLDHIKNDPDWEGGGGSPLESLYERHDELTRELKRRKEKVIAEWTSL